MYSQVLHRLEKWDFSGKETIRQKDGRVSGMCEWREEFSPAIASTKIQTLSKDYAQQLLLFTRLFYQNGPFSSETVYLKPNLPSFLPSQLPYIDFSQVIQTSKTGLLPTSLTCRVK